MNTKLSKYVDIEIVPDDDCQPKSHAVYQEDGVDVPFDRIKPEILHNMIAEFVTREWEEIGDSSCTLEEKIEQGISSCGKRKPKSCLTYLRIHATSSSTIKRER
jgi:uncharacterized protein YheU (UPF0270 family)